MERKSGVLLPVFSLPSPYGIGTFGAEAYRFVDFLSETHQSYWQILPLNPTGYGDSPYQSFSAFAYNPYFIDLDLLVKEGLLTESDLDSVRPLPADHVDYGWVYTTRFGVLRTAFNNFMNKGLNMAADFQKFEKEQAFWLDSYANFMVLKGLNGGRSWQEWPEAFKNPRSQETHEALNHHYNEVFYYKFMQFEAFKQCVALKKYANSKGIKIIGDAPIYMALDSADVWGNPEAFLLDRDKRPVLVAGVPPDYFSATGQLWGNPIYNYPEMKKEGWTFWRNRIKAAKNQCDVLRIDHFRGLADYWAVPFGATDARPGHWVIGPGRDLVDAVNDEAGDMQIIAEDLGELSQAVLDLKAYSNWPGMKIVQFAFDDGKPTNKDLPANYEENCIGYLGTHDNQTTMGWLDSHQNLWPTIASFLHIGGPLTRDVLFDTVAYTLTRSNAKWVIYTMQDMLKLGDEARLNAPSTTGKNWQFRLPADYDRPLVRNYLTSLAKEGGRG